MVTYDSTKGQLCLVVRYLIEGTPVKVVGEIDLSEIPELERQRLIAVAKLVSAFANGHDVNRHEKRRAKEGEAELNSASLLESTKQRLAATLSRQAKGHGDAASQAS